MPGIQAGGIGSGLDITGLVNQLVTAEGKVKFDRMTRQETIAQGELSALGTLKGALSDFKNSISILRSASQLGGRTANNTNNDIFSVSVNEDAPVGSYAVQVLALAQAHKVSSAGYASKSDTVGSGNLTFQFGTFDNLANTFTLNPDRSTRSVLITPENSSLQAIRDAVNEANIGVNANIINTGTTETLVFSSTTMGAENSLKITVNDDDGNNTDMSGLSKLAYDPTAAVGNGLNQTQAQAGIDAHLNIDGIDVYAQSNTVTDVIEGVTMNLQKLSNGITSTATVSNYTANASTRVSGFVTSFNSMVGVLNDLTKYDPKTKESGWLNGDQTTRTLQSQIRNVISEVVEGLDGKYRALADIGVTTTANGTLKLDSTKLDAAINSDFDIIGRIFAPTAETSDSQILFSGYTAESTIGDYLVNISQMATQGSAVGSNAANLTITTGVNDALIVTLDGQNATLLLSPGIYSADTLAAEVQSRINGCPTFSDSNLSLTVSQNAGVITMTSDQYGSSTLVQLSGNGSNDLLGATPTYTNGLDVQGTIGGLQAMGSGQFLSGTGIATGIELQVTGGNIGNRGNVSFTRGVADLISHVLEGYLGPDNILDDRTEMINGRLKSIGERREVLNTKLEAYRKRLVTQFAALDKLISKLHGTSDFLARQLDNMSRR